MCLTFLGHYALNDEAAPIFSNKTEFAGLTRGDRGKGGQEQKHCNYKRYRWLGEVLVCNLVMTFGLCN